MNSSEREMQFFGFVEDMKFVSEDSVGFPAVKSRIWPNVLEQAKNKVGEEYDEDDRLSAIDRINALHSLRSARLCGGDPAVKVFRQVNEDIVRSEMSAALNNLMLGNVNRLWSKRDFHGLGACYGKVFFSMQVSESRLVNRMPVLFLAGLLEMVNNDRACLSSTWWDADSECLKKLGMAVKSICSGRFRKGEKVIINHFAKVFVKGIKLINYLIDDQYTFRGMDGVIDALEEEDPTQYQVPAKMLQDIRDSLKFVHPTFHTEFSYLLDLHFEIAAIGTTGKGKLSKLKKYAVKDNDKVLVSCFLPIGKDVAYMLEEVGKMVNEVELNGYFQSVVSIFEGADEDESRKTKYPTAHGRALLLAVPIKFPQLIEAEFNKDVCVKAILERLPLPGGFGKPRRKRGKKRAVSPSPSQSEIEEIHKAVLGSDLESDEEEEENLESGQATE